MDNRVEGRNKLRRAAVSSRPIVSSACLIVPTGGQNFRRVLCIHLCYSALSCCIVIPEFALNLRPWLVVVARHGLLLASFYSFQEHFLSGK